jgi:GH24 family phage-related lysozyme (muramidase)
VINQTHWIGVVENNLDEYGAGRVQARIMGIHTENKTILPTEKLPWAFPMGATTSASISGIGQSPTGPVKGTVVILIFADPDQQHPIYIGTLGGIPQGFGSIDVSSDDFVVKDTDGNLPQETAVPTNAKPANLYTSVSKRTIDLIKNEESLRLTSYQDTSGIWTIGYGTTFINGVPVGPGMTITKDQAEQYFSDSVNNDAAKAVRRLTKSLITQSMFDSLVSFVYNLGQGNYAKSSLLADLNASQYELAAARFDDYTKDNAGNVQNGLVARRKKERDLFLLDGIPNGNGLVERTTFIDDPDSAALSDSQIGFKDPTGKYPLFKNEPDTNRLARHAQIRNTIVFKKEAARDKGVPIAGGGTWDQSPIPYNAQYPYNHVYQSESGHVLEFDDTPNKERVHLYHKSGTFEETDANGTNVRRIVGDGYEILERNGYVHINGVSNVTIDGASNVRIGGAHNVDIIGKTTINIFNDIDLNVSGTMDVSVKENINFKAANIRMEASNIDIKGNTTIHGNSVDVKTGDYSLTTDVANLTYSDELHTMIGGDTFNRHNAGTDFSCPGDPSRQSNTDCSGVDTARSATSTGLTTPQAKQTPEQINFGKLTVITRGVESAANYETPEDGTPTTYIEYRVENGLVDPEELVQMEEIKAEQAPKNTVQPIDSSCDLIFAMDDFPPSMQLSKYFTLGAMTKGGSRKPIDQFGLTKQAIVCNMKQLAVNCLDPIYDKYPNMVINSGFRRPGDAKNSSSKSQHYLGMAADIHLNGYTREQYYNAVKEIQKLVPYDQLILEYTGAQGVWIHVSFNPKGNRKQVFTMKDHKVISNYGEFKLLA